MTATQTAARPDPSGAGSTPHPCDTATLGAPCTGGCGRKLHTQSSRGPKGACADGHPNRYAHGMCSGCSQRASRRTARGTAQLGELAPPGEANTSWQRHATCQGADPDSFFPDVPGGVRGGARAAAEHIAWRYCHRCPVAVACGVYADRTRSVGLWGGVWRHWVGSRYARKPVLEAAREAS